MTSPTPSQLGYFMPAEWTQHAATWLSWPKDPETWPGRVAQVEQIFLEMISTLAPHEVVNLLVDDEQTEQTIRTRYDFTDAANIRFHQIKTVDAWIRDYGPNFLIDRKGNLAFNNWTFNAWGNKYPELTLDDSIPTRLHALIEAEQFNPEIVLEGGSIEVNGSGCVLTTEQCLLNRNRNPHLSAAEVEKYLKDYLGVSKVLWLGEGIVGDDTDGHIDDIARFVAPGVVVTAIEDDPQDANYKLLQDNLRRLQLMTDVNDRSFEIVTLPMPGMVAGASIAARDLKRLPASYANFYIANNVVLVPLFGRENDRRALEILQMLFPSRRVAGLNCEPLVWGMGTIHCVTQQEPSKFRI